MTEYEHTAEAQRQAQAFGEALLRAIHECSDTLEHPPIINALGSALAEVCACLLVTVPNPKIRSELYETLTLSIAQRIHTARPLGQTQMVKSQKKGS